MLLLLLHVFLSIRTRQNSLSSPLLPLGERLIQSLRELRLGPYFWPFLVHYIDRDRDNESKTSKDGRGILHGPTRNIFVKRRRVHSCYTSQKIAGEIVAASC
jgi:hypothetical protein